MYAFSYASENNDVTYVRMHVDCIILATIERLEIAISDKHYLL